MSLEILDIKSRCNSVFVAKISSDFVHRSDCYQTERLVRDSNFRRISIYRLGFMMKCMASGNIVASNVRSLAIKLWSIVCHTPNYDASFGKIWDAGFLIGKRTLYFNFTSMNFDSYGGGVLLRKKNIHISLVNVHLALPSTKFCFPMRIKKKRRLREKWKENELQSWKMWATFSLFFAR